MRKLICFVLISFNFAFTFGLTYKIKINNFDIGYTESNTVVNVELEYSLKNDSKKDVFLYDLLKKNDMHFEKDIYSNNVISKQIYIIKPITENSWNASWGYNPCYPNFVKIECGKKFKSKVNLKYVIPKEIDPYLISYEFNLITADNDVSEYLIKSISEKKSGNELKNKIIRFDLNN